MSEETENLQRNRRKTLVAFVVKRSGDKTIKVAYDYRKSHPLYHKEVKRRTVVHAHDEKNEAREGDRVEIMETRPLSKHKRWRLVRVVESAPVVG